MNGSPPTSSSAPLPSPLASIPAHARSPAPGGPFAPPPLSVRLRRAALTVALFGVLGGLLSVGAIPCAFARIFRTPCPGCGSTRAVLALAHGDLHGVMRFNPFGALMAVLLGVLGAQAFASILLHGDFRGAGGGRVGLMVKRGIFIVITFELALWIARFFGWFGGPVPV